MAEVFRLQGALILDDKENIDKKLDEIDKKGAQAGKSLDQMGKRADKTSGALNLKLSPAAKNAALAVGAMAAAGAAAVTAYGVHAVRSFADFEQAMSQVGAVSQATSGELARLTKVALEQGRATKFSGLEAAEGLNFLALAGFSVEESIETLPSVLSLAAAANMDLGQAADITTKILSGMRLPVSQAAHVTDVLAEASSNSNTSVRQLGQALSFAAPLAAEAGISIEEVAAAVGVLGDAGIQGERAGTGLRNILGQLINPASTAAKTLEELGIQTRDSSGELLSLTEILQNTADAGFTGANAMEAFGLEAGPSFAILMAAGAESVADFTTQLENAQGAAEEMAERQLDNLAGSAELLSGEFSGVTQVIGRDLAPTIREFVDWLTANMPTVQRIFEQVFGVAGFALEQFLAGAKLVFRQFQTETERHMDDLRQLDAEAETLQGLVDRYEELATKSDLTAMEQSELQEVVVALSQQFPTLTEELQNTDTAMSDAIPTIQGYIANLQVLSQTRLESMARVAEVELPALEQEKQQLLENRDAIKESQQAFVDIVSDIERVAEAHKDGEITWREASERIQELAEGHEGLSAATQLSIAEIERRTRFGLDMVTVDELVENVIRQATDQVREQNDAFIANEDALDNVNAKMAQYELALQIVEELQGENITVHEAVQRALGEMADAAEDAADRTVTANEEVIESNNKRAQAIADADAKVLADIEETRQKRIEKTQQAHRILQNEQDEANQKRIQTIKDRDAEILRLQNEAERNRFEKTQQGIRIHQAEQDEARNKEFQARMAADAKEESQEEKTQRERLEKTQQFLQVAASIRDEENQKRIQTIADRDAEIARQADAFQQEQLRKMQESLGLQIKEINFWKDEFVNTVSAAHGIVNSLASGFETMFDAIRAGTNVFEAAGEGVKAFLLGIITMLEKQLIAVQVAEVAKALAMAPLTLGATLAAIPAIVAAVAPAILVLEGLKSVIRGIKLERGGTLSGGDDIALVGERGPEIRALPRGATVVPLNDQRVNEVAMRAFAGGLIAPSMQARPMVAAGGGFRTANIFVELDGERIAAVIGQPIVDLVRLQQGIRDL